MGRRSQERMTRQCLEARVESVAAREKFMAEARREEEKAFLNALAAEIQRRKEERARWINAPDAL